MKLTLKYYFLLLSLFPGSVFCQQAFKTNSILSSGDFYKVQIFENGVYKLDLDFLKSLGVNKSDINLNKLGVFGAQTGMLPQANSQLSVDDLEEIPIFIVDGDDGSLDKEDYILFYAQGPHKLVFDENKKIISREFNLYDSVNYYFVSTTHGSGKKIQQKASLNQSIGTISIYDHMIFYETDKHTIIKSGREWFGEKLEVFDPLNFNFKMEGLVPHRSIKVSTSFLSTATSKSSVLISSDSRPIGEINMNGIPQSLYGDKGVIGNGTTSVRIDDLDNPDSFNLEFEYQNENEGTAYINHFSVQAPRYIKLYGKQSVFQSLASLNFGTSAFLLSDATPSQVVWDITNPLNPDNQQFEIQSNGKGSFRTHTDSLRQFIIFQGSDFDYPRFIKRIPNQNLHALEAADGLIITKASLLPAAERLASFRKEFDNLDIHTVDVDQIYHEFSGGRKDVTAIRNFIKMIYDRGNRLKYVLLLGEAAYSYYSKGDLVPTYQSRNSLHNVHSYASDDYFGFMESEEGDWFETNSINNTTHTMDLGIGRIPVNSLEEAEQVVEKIIDYESSKNALGNWRSKISFVADDGESNKFQLQSDYLASDLELTEPTLNSDRIFVDAFPQNLPENLVTREINDRMQSGVLIMDFIGHGGETAWTNEGILQSTTIQRWNNSDKLPIFLTATCEFGRFDDPERRSGAELALLNPKGGSIAMFSTTRPVFLGTNFELSKAFYNSLNEQLTKENGVRLGDLARQTKNQSIAGIVNRNFSLLGDPFVTLSFPQEKIAVTSITKKTDSEDSVLNPLDRVSISGEVRKSGQVDPEFNGVIELTFFDKPTPKKTLGDEGPETVMEFYNQENILFKGKASVSAGEFQMELILPLDLDTLLGDGKLSLYASHANEVRDAGGAVTNMVTGGTATSAVQDDEPPTIHAYLNNESFTLGEVVTSDPTLFVKLEDESGLNLSSRYGRGIKGILDFESELDLTPFYQPELNRIDRGLVTYQFNNLTPGKHHLAVEAYDSYNNKSRTEIDFLVVDTTQVVLADLNYFPNPSKSCVNFQFKYWNNPENTKVQFLLYSRDGRKIDEVTRYLNKPNDQEEYQETIVVCSTQNGGKLQNGMYYFILQMTPGESSKNRQSGRIVFVH